MKTLLNKFIIILLTILVCTTYIFPHRIYAYDEPSEQEKEKMKTYIESYMHNEIEQYLDSYNNIITDSKNKISDPKDLPEEYQKDLTAMLEEKKVNANAIILYYDAELANKYSQYLQTSGDSELFEKDASSYEKKYSRIVPVTSVNDDQEYIGITFGGILDTTFGFLTYVFKFIFLIPGLAINFLLTEIAAAGGGNFQTVSMEDILFNRVPLVDINILSMSETASGEAVTSTIGKIRESVAGWYMAFRNFSIAVSFAMLIYIGIKMALDSFAERRAKYKQMLIHWIVGLALTFLLHYFIAFVLDANTALIRVFENSTGGKDIMAELLAQAFDIALIKSWGAAIMYTIMLFVTLTFLIIYIKRMLMTCFLIMIAPLITISYSVDKIGNNKSEILNQWVKEFSYNVLIQPFHCIVYVVFMNAAMANMQSDHVGFGGIVFSIASLLCMFTAEKLIRLIFGFRKSQSVASKLFTGKMVTSAINDAKTIRNARNEQKEEEEPEAPLYMPGGEKTEEAVANVKLKEENIKDSKEEKNEKVEKGEKSKPAPTPAKERTKVQKAVQKVQDHTPIIARDIGRGYVNAAKGVTGISRLEGGRERKKTVDDLSFEEKFLIASKKYAKDNGLSKKQLDLKIQQIRKNSFNDLKTTDDRLYKMWISKMDGNLSKKGAKNTTRAMSDFLDEKYQG